MSLIICSNYAVKNLKDSIKYFVFGWINKRY